jgi:cell division protein FtsW (lipid II flippase)
MQAEKSGSDGTIARRERLLLGIAAAFVLITAVALALTGLRFSWGHLCMISLAYAAVFGGLHAFLNRHLPDRDPLLLPVAALLTGWGLVLIGRLALSFLLRQTGWLAVAAILLAVLVRYRGDLRWLRRFRYTWLFSGLALLAVTLLFGVNPSGYGPRLWLGAFGIYVQPAEPLKLLMIVYLASYLGERHELIATERWHLWRWKLPPMAYVGPLLAMFGLAMVILAWQQDLGAAMLFFFTFLIMLYLATGQLGYVAAGLASFVIAGLIGYWLSDHVALRIDGWLNPWPEAADRAFQIVQSLLAFSAGGLLGQGVGLGSPTYIPAVHTDFVFAAIGEEFGLIGTLAVVALYGILMLRGFRVASRTRRRFDRFLAAGLVSGLVVQAWVIMAGSVRVAPITGVTLPFVSYGGSSLVTSYIALGLILCISDGLSPATGETTAPFRLPHLPLLPQLRHLAAGLSIALGAVALASGWWAVPRSAALRARPDDPRGVLYEQRIVRGEVVDRNGEVLAGVRIEPDGTVIRDYPVPEAAPVVGYATLRYGTGGIEAAFDEQLRGEARRTSWEQAWDELLHRPPHGNRLRLTLDADLQRQAQALLDGRGGAIVLMNAGTGDILAMTSSPTFDPGQLEEQWDALREDPAAPLLNRSAQGLYQPGAALQTVVLAQALGQGLIELSQPVPSPTASIRIDGSTLACRSTPESPTTWAQAYALACPAPFADLADMLGPANLEEAYRRWGLVAAPALEIPTAAADWEPGQSLAMSELRAAGVGQGDLVVSPLQMALVASALANDGTMPAPRVVDSLEDDQGWRASRPLGSARDVLPSESARLILASLTDLGDGIVGHWGAAIAGSDAYPQAWFIGATTSPGARRYAIAVLIEQATEPDLALETGLGLLRATAGGR